MSSFYQNNNSSLIGAFYNAKSQNQFLVTTCRKYYQIQQKLIKLRVKLFSWFKQSKIFL
jgi:hypothetical protein